MKLYELESALKNERLKADDLAVKLSKLNIWNINKKQKRRDEKIVSSQDTIDKLTWEIRLKQK